MKKIRVLQLGMGPLGKKIASFIGERENLETVAAVDINPKVYGQKFIDVTGVKNGDFIIHETLDEALDSVKADVVILTTVSDVPGIKNQVLEILEHKLSVVSTCEELSYPWDTYPDDANEIDTVARDMGVNVLGTGVNPGFLMDTLPTMLSSVCQYVDSIEVNRFQDAAFRRLPFQIKIGAGADLKEFERKKAEGNLRHVGLTESIQFIASKMGWNLTKTEDIISPVIAKSHIRSGSVRISKGKVTGVRQEGNGYLSKKKVISLVFQAAIGEPKSYDEIIIQGSPDVRSVIEGGVNGDIATCAITLNVIPSLLKSSPGLKTMADINLPSYWM